LKYYESATGESLKPTSLRQVLNILRSKNLIKRIKREYYMINPAYMGLSNKSALRSLINDYNEIKETIALRPVKKSKK
jgi:predicted transcriptional regulator of viral defense system